MNSIVKFVFKEEGIIYSLLLLIALIGILLLILSADISIQLQMYDFGISIISWRKDVSISLGSSLISSVVLIFLYDRVIRHQEKEDKKKRSIIAAKKIKG